MNVLYIDRKGARISLQRNTLQIRIDGEALKTVPISLVSKLVCIGNIEVKTGHLAEIAKQGTDIVIFGTRIPRGGMTICGPGTADVRRRLRQYRLYSDQRTKRHIAAKIVRSKIIQQKKFLCKVREERKDLRRQLTKVIEKMSEFAKSTNMGILPVQTIRGIEGAAAKQYFAVFAELIPPVLNFKTRVRRPAKDPVNALLNLSYTLLHAEVYRAVQVVGLDPQLGYLHEPSHGRDSLVCDLVEPFRPEMDQFVWNLVRKRKLSERNFAKKNGATLLKKNGRRIFYSEWQPVACRLERKLRRLALRLARGEIDL